MAKDPTIKVSLDYESKSSAKSKLNSRITEIEQVAKTLKVGLDFKSVSAKELNASLSKLSGSISKITLDKFNKDLENSLNYAERLAKSINEISKTNIGKSIKGDSAKSIEKEIKEQKAIQDKARQDELNAQKKHEEEKAKAEKDAQKKRISDTKKFREEMKAEEEAIAKEMAKIKQENEKNDKSFSEYLDKATDPSKAGNGIKGMVRQGVSSVNQESKDALSYIKKQIKEAEALAKAMDEAQQKQEALNNPPQPKAIGQDGLDDKVSKYSREIEKLSLSGNISKKAIEDLQNRLNSFTSDTPVNEIRDFERAFGELKGYDGNINTLSSKLSKVQEELKKISTTAIDLNDEVAIKEANRLELELEQVNEELRKMSTGEITSKNKVTKDITGIQKNVEELGKSLETVDDKAIESRNAFKEFGQVLGVYSLAYATVNMVSRAFRDGVDAVKSYDKAMTTLSITMNGFTETRLDNFGKKLVQLSNDLSTTSSKVMEIATTFANASETMESILGKTQSATIMSNISGLSGQDSVSVIEGAMQQFDALKDKSEKSAMKVADSMTSISKSMGIDFGVGIKGMQEGVEKFGAVANQLGMDIDQTLAMIGTIQEKMRIDGSEAGTALRSVAARTMRIKGVDGVEDSDFSNAEKALKSFNVEIRKANGQMNDFWDIMKQVYDMKSKGLINDQEWFNLSEAMGKRYCPLVA